MIHRGAVSLAEALRLVVLTDLEIAAPRTVEGVVEAALAGGATAVQLRMKDRPTRDMLAAGRRLRALTDDVGALLFVNDRADVAVAVGADGLHVGPNDPPVTALRKAYGPELLIGASADDPEWARVLELHGADYIGCGAVFGSTTKDVGGEAIGPEGLARVAAAVRVPVVGIGGITPANVGALSATGAAGVAVVGAVMGAEDPESAARALRAGFSASGPFTPS